MSNIDYYGNLRKYFDTYRYAKYLLYLPLIFMLFIFSKKLVLFLIFVAVTGIIVYFTKLYHFPVDLSPLFFLEIVITRYYGLQYTMLFIFLAYIVPKTFAGTSMKWDSYVFISISMLANFFAMAFPSLSLLLVGFITSLFQYIGGVIFQSNFKPMIIAAVDGVANIFNNVIWFLIFSDLIVKIM